MRALKNNTKNNEEFIPIINDYYELIKTLIDENVKISPDDISHINFGTNITLKKIVIPDIIFSVDISKEVIDHARSQQSLFIRKCKNNATINVEYLISDNVNKYKYLKYKNKYQNLVKNI